MTISRVKPSNWATGEKLTSTEMNAVDTNGAKALDKTSAGDTLSGEISVASTGGFSFASGSHASFASGSLLESASSSSVWLTLGTDGWMELQSGSYVNVSAGQIRTSGTGTIKWNNTDWPLLNTRSYSRYHRVVDLVSIGTYDNTIGLWDSASGTVFGGASAIAVHGTIPAHDGASLTSATLIFKPGVHAALPTNKVQLTISEVDAATGSVLSTQTFTHTPGILALYSNLTQSWTVTLSPSITMAPTTKTYKFTITDENGTNSVAGTEYMSLSFTYSSIVDMRFK